MDRVHNGCWIVLDDLCVFVGFFVVYCWCFFRSQKMFVFPISLDSHKIQSSPEEFRISSFLGSSDFAISPGLSCLRRASVSGPTGWKVGSN